MAYHIIHEIQPQARVGLSINYRSFKPATANPLDHFAANMQARLFNDLFPRTAEDGKLRLLTKKVSIAGSAKSQDFIGVNYYTRDLVSFDLRYAKSMFGRRYYHKDAELSGTGFIANQPEGFFEALKWATQFNVPILVTENGVEDAEDKIRPRYLAEHIMQMWRAVNFNFPIKGYYHWSLVDNFEWERGWSQRFGLWGLDTETQARIRRPSVDFYASICRENGLSSDMAAKYCPEILQKLFPD
jgi:beta-glucosidase